MIAHNLAVIRQRITQAATRAHLNPADVRIVAAAKGQGTAAIQAALEAGIHIIGHNYVQEAVQETPPDVASRAELHMIGRLQKNKAGKAVELFSVIHTVDDTELASVLDRKARAIGRTVRVLVQVNLGHEPQKAGIDEDKLTGLIGHIGGLFNLRLEGLMTMPPFFDDPERARPYFARLRQLRDTLVAGGVPQDSMRELSMGMTGDFEAAVEEGATLVRIGTALFGPRMGY